MSNNNGSLSALLSAEDAVGRLFSDEESGNESCPTSFLDTDDESEDEYEPEGDFVDMNGIQSLVDPKLLMNPSTNPASDDNFSQDVPLPSERDSLLLLDRDMIEEEDDGGKCIVYAFFGIKYTSALIFYFLYVDVCQPHASDSLLSNDDQMASSSSPLYFQSTEQMEEDSNNFSSSMFQSQSSSIQTDSDEIDSAQVHRQHRNPHRGTVECRARGQFRCRFRSRGGLQSRNQSRGRDRSRGQGLGRFQGQGQDDLQCNDQGRGQDRSQGRSRRRSRGRGRSRGRSRGRGRGRGLSGGQDSSVPSLEKEWKWDNARTDSAALPPLPTFSGNLPGPKGEACGVRNPNDCFFLFLTSEFYDELLTQSNLYAEQQRAAKKDTKPWTPITKEELVAFIGVNIAMGVISLPGVKEYWSSNPIISHPWFRTIFSRDRFLEILKYVHIADNSKALSRTDPNYDKLWKVRYMLDSLSKRCLELYDPHRQLSVDESMIGTKCRLSFIQYLPKKPVKWGIKVWVCSDARNGYIYTFSIYCGANSTDHSHPKGLSYGVVFKLLEHCLHKGYSVYMDNYYSSPVLFEDLLAAGTVGTGTLRTTRKQFPKMLKPFSGEPPKERGTTMFAYHDNITVVRWADNRDVYAISTLNSDSLTKVKRQVDGEVKEIPCPEIIADYNSFMGGVDLADQAMCYYSLGRKTVKWWRRVFWRMHDHAITNAYIIYKHNNASLQKVQTNLQFRLTLAEALTSGVVAMRAGPGRSPTQMLSRLKGKHFIYRSTTRKRCAVCAYKKALPYRRNIPKSKQYTEKKIKTWCPKCEVHLCVGKCFELYHTRTNYKH